MVTKVIGKVDGQEVIYERSEGNLWKATVPLDLDGMYAIEVSAYTEAGNTAFCTKMLLIVDPATLCAKIVPLDYMVEVIPEDYAVDAIREEYAVEAQPDPYEVAVQPALFTVEAVYPIHEGRCCCE